MAIRLIHNFGEPLSPQTHSSLIIQAVKHYEGCCLYCGVQMPQTGSNPYAGLSVCKFNRDGSAEIDNLITLCDFCCNFNSLEKLKGKGQFVELPWLSQSHLTNFLRVVYCSQASTDKSIQTTKIYQGSSAILESLARSPKEWAACGFDGSVEMVIKAVRDNTGFIDKTNPNDVLYIDRLRFFFSPVPFKTSIDFWLPTIESQIIKAEQDL